MLPRKLRRRASPSLQAVQRSSAPSARLVMTVSNMSMSIRLYSVFVANMSAPKTMKLSMQPNISAR